MIHAASIFVKYGDRVLLNYVDLTISPNDRVGLVGRNGAGKSTLLKIIADESSPHDGKVSYPKDATIGFLHQDLEIPKEKTVRQEAEAAFETLQRLENRLLEITTELEQTEDYESPAYYKLLEEMDEINTRLAVSDANNRAASVEKILKGLGFKENEFDRKIGTFSGGWQMRVLLAKMLLQTPDFLLLDEPTNHLDIESIIWLEDYLQNYQGAVVVISHDKQFLDKVTNRTVEVELGKLHDYKCSYSRYLVERVDRMEKLQAAYENQQKAIAQKERTIERFMAKATKTKMAQSMKKQLDKIERIEMETRDTRSMKIQFPPAPRAGLVTMQARQVSKSYGEKKVLEAIDFKIERGERIAFVGQNGMGKSTLAKILVNEIEPTSGSLEEGHNLKIGYYAQDQSDAMNGAETVLETIENLANEETRPNVRKILGAFMFSGEDVDKKVSVLSGGERARLALACLLLEPVNLLVLDEPTNHLDIPAKEVLKEALMQYDGAMIVVSHDRDFLIGLTDKVLEFRDRKTKEFLGDIQYFLQKRQVADMRTLEQSEAKKKDTPKHLSKGEQEAVQQLKKRIKSLENKIEKLETKLEAEKLKMADPSFYDNPDYEQKLKKYRQLESESEEATQAWEEAVLELDKLE